MKATGIVRRIDELGRVVIPKEIRRTLRIKEGDPLEIFTDRDELMLKKYSPIATLERFSKATARQACRDLRHRRRFTRLWRREKGSRWQKFIRRYG